MTTITGTPDNDTLPGTNRPDDIHGDWGDDFLQGLGGDDILWGDGGLDRLHGGNGNDLLLGGAGRDKLYGGAGNDTFQFLASTDSGVGNLDIIYDFEHGIDKIDVRALGYTGFTSGHAAHGQLRIAYSAASDRTYLRDDYSDFEIAIKGDYRGNLTNDDFRFAVPGVNVGHFGGSLGADSTFGTPATNLGYNAVNLANLRASDIAGLDAVIVYQQGVNGYDPKILSNASALADYVSHGGVLIIADSNVQGGEQLLPGLTGEHLVQNGDSHIDFVHDSGLIANGPGGTLTDTTLDGGAWSNDGYVLDSELNSSVVRVQTTNDPNHVISFAYAYGAGAVYYTTVPLSEYLPQANRTDLVKAMEDYAENIVSWAVAGHHDLLTL